MTWFLCVLIGMLAMTTLGKLVWLSSGNLPQRKPLEEAGDVAINVALIAWAAWLLALQP